MKKQIIFLFFFLFLSVFGMGRDMEYKVLFTQPGSSSSPVVDHLCRFVAESKFSIDAALYDLNNERVISALKSAVIRGVKVRLVLESDNYFRRNLSSLRKAGILIVHDKKQGLMHNKFFIFDKSVAWTGSFNVTENGSRKNNNNAVFFRLPGLADTFTAEFEEMYCGGVFGNKEEPGPFPWLKRKKSLRSGKNRVSVFFSPEDDIENVLLPLIKKAKKSIRFMAFSFTSDSLGEALISKKSEGLSVKGLVESHGSNSAYSEYIKFIVEGIDVRRDSNIHLMHHKVIIIDGSIVITGSYNFSKGAGIRNDENLLVIEGEGPAKLYLKEFEKLYRQGIPFRSKK